MWDLLTAGSFCGGLPFYGREVKTQRHKGHKDTKKAAIKNYLRRPSLCLCALCVFVFYLLRNRLLQRRGLMEGLLIRSVRNRVRDDPASNVVINALSNHSHRANRDTQ